MISHFLFMEKVLMCVTGSMLKIIAKLLTLSFTMDRVGEVYNVGGHNEMTKY